MVKDVSYPPRELPLNLRKLDLESLIGCTEEEARRRVEDTGGTLRCHSRAYLAMTAEYRPTRVTVWLETTGSAKSMGFSEHLDSSIRQVRK